MAVNEAASATPNRASPTRARGGGGSSSGPQDGPSSSAGPGSGQAATAMAAMASAIDAKASQMTPAQCRDSSRPSGNSTWMTGLTARAASQIQVLVHNASDPPGKGSGATWRSYIP